MKKILSILFLLLATTISAFAFGVDSTMGTVMDSWKGSHIDKVIDRWGYPTDEKTVAGHKLYIWKTERTESSSGYTGTKAHKDKKEEILYNRNLWRRSSGIHCRKNT